MRARASVLPPSSAVSAHDCLAALGATGPLDAPGTTEDLDRLACLVTRTLGVPVALVSLVDRNRQVFKGQHSSPTCGRRTPPSHSFCQHLVDRNAPLAVDEAPRGPLVGANTDLCPTPRWILGDPAPDANLLDLLHSADLAAMEASLGRALHTGAPVPRVAQPAPPGAHGRHPERGQHPGCR